MSGNELMSFEWLPQQHGITHFFKNSKLNKVLQSVIRNMNTINKTKNWIEKMVIGLNLCPFAKQPFRTGKIRYVVVEETNLSKLVEVLMLEMRRLVVTDAKEIETTLIIHPDLLTDFYDYNDFLAVADEVLHQELLEGIVQIASFHPQYQFADTSKDAVENYTNRSPYPMLHLLREASLEKALEHYPNPEAIPERNVTYLKQLGLNKIKQLSNPHF